MFASLHGHREITMLWLISSRVNHHSSHISTILGAAMVMVEVVWERGKRTRPQTESGMSWRAKRAGSSPSILIFINNRKKQPFKIDITIILRTFNIKTHHDRIATELL